MGGCVVQEMGLVVMNPSMEEMASSTRPQLTERRPRPHKEQQLSCPRCQSTNTKFCYYNNYSLSQPRYFCKTCRRYWTEGGSLRNVPVGGGSRKNKRHSTAAPRSPPLTPHRHRHLMLLPRREGSPPIFSLRRRRARPSGTLDFMTRKASNSPSPPWSSCRRKG
ncbi:unnamed protein product [Spirodela intermedia]|uniref:Dof zinc finger protein n=1 Tax=Spirodela intermedia TaxID=51605 RepID=A0A7I8J1T3_SPIIN|nr:unnamed protein product [Spirodela intermedia]CAA6663351.1 unnamed protein product [Spirodela intermedia]